MENAALIFAFIAMFLIYSCAVYLVGIFIVTIVRLIQKQFQKFKLKGYNHASRRTIF